MAQRNDFIQILKDIQKNETVNDSLLASFTEDEKRLVRTIYERNLVGECLEYLSSLDVDEEWYLTQKKISALREPHVPLWRTAMKYAAILIGILGLVYVFKSTKTENETPFVSNTSIVLKMDGNREKIIKKGEQFTITSEKGTVVATQIGNKISYVKNTKIEKLVYNELVIPYGELFELELSDGTSIMLNSGTKIKYPIAFVDDKKRELFIEGEAYFKVKTNPNKPFVVHAGDVAVEVLGTEFNLSSYPEDADVGTVLVEGKVKMSNAFAPDDSVFLEPGTKASWSKQNHITKVERVDTDFYTSWLEGELVFRDASFQHMITKLERNYNVKIENRNQELFSKKFNARFNVNIETIEDVLKSISTIYPFKYTMDNNRILIQ